MIIQIYQVSIMNIIDTYEECFNPFLLPHLFLKHSGFIRIVDLISSVSTAKVRDNELK